MKRIVFVCVENSNRSQMAESFARIYASGAAEAGDPSGGSIEAYSAGSRPSGRVNPKAITAMRELGYDLSTHHSKSLDDLPAGPYAAVVTMGCGDACPHLDAQRREDWAIPDPKEMPPSEFNQVRDLIAAKVKELLSCL